MTIPPNLLSGKYNINIQGGRVYSWGLNNYGQLGRQAYSNQLTPGPLEYQGYPVYATDIAANGTSSYCIRSGSRRALAWGKVFDDSSKVPPDGSEDIIYSTPTPFPLGTGQTTIQFVNVNAQSWNCAWQGAWGTMATPGFPSGYTANDIVGTTTAYGGAPPTYPSAGVAMSITGGPSSSIAWACGTTYREAGLSGSAYTNSIIIKYNRTLWTTRGNYPGNGSASSALDLLQVGTDADWAQCYVTTNNRFAIKLDGTLWAWGLNAYGSLGDGTSSTRLSPVQIGTSSWVKLACYENTTLGIRSDGTLWGWGEGYSSSPTQIGVSTWKDIAVGGYYSNPGISQFHYLGIGVDDSLYAWGYNAYGQLGDGTTTTRSAPTLISSDRWFRVSAARGVPADPYRPGGHSLGIKIEARG